ncbi:MAG: hypothetical protein R3D58_13625 [Saprospiraceae bacterium]
MKFFHPQIQLARETVFDEPDAYYLHVVTFCPNTSFRADGFSVSEAHLAEGRLEVAVKLRKDPGLPEMNYITPIVHTIALGSIAFPNEEGDIEVQVEVEGAVGSGSGTRSDTEPTKTGGKGTVSTTTADDKSRPILDDFF